MKTVKLSDVCEIFAGGDVPKNALSRQKSGKYQIPIFTNGEKNNGLYGFTDRARVTKPSVTVSARGTIGFSAIRQEPFFPAVRLIVMTPNVDILDVRYLQLAINLLDFTNTGTSIPQLTVPSINNYEIPLLPIAEQKKIVEKLDRAFEKINRAIELTQKNLQNSQDFFLNSLEQIFGKSSSYPKNKLSEVSEYFNGLTYSPKDVVDNGTVVLRSSNIQGDVLDFSDIVCVNTKIPDKKFVCAGDILICSRNGSKRLIGKTAVIKDLSETMTFGAFMMIIRSKYNPYLIWFFKSREFKRQMASGENTSINQITRYMLDEVIVPFPDLEEQNKLSLELQSIWIKSKKLSELYQNKLEKLEHLKQSMIEEAFQAGAKV